MRPCVPRSLSPGNRNNCLYSPLQKIKNPVDGGGKEGVEEEWTVGHHSMESTTCCVKVCFLTSAFPFTSGTQDIYFHSKKQNLPTHQYNCFLIAPKSRFLLLCFFALDGSRASNGSHAAGANNNPTGKRNSRGEEFEKLSVSALKVFFLFFY